MTEPAGGRAFHRLRVAAVDRLTEDAVAVSFAVPAGLRGVFAFRGGQHVTVRLETDAGEVRRSYSICSSEVDLKINGTFKIGVREIGGGVFSGYAVRRLRAGDSVDVLPPLGQFTTAFDPGRARHYAAVAAGSGITPVLSLAATALDIEPGSEFSLLYGNRTGASAMFTEELADLKDRYPGRFALTHVLSREPQLAELFSGRLDAARLGAILDHPELIDLPTVDEWFLCGPYAMVTDARGVLAERGVDSSTIHTELFHVPDDDAVGPAPTAVAWEQGSSEVTMVLDGRESHFVMGRDERVLDAALRVRGELPYSCKGGVCSTCRARLVTGEVRMARNFALEPAELAAGYVLTCQASPITDRLMIDYDG